MTTSNNRNFSRRSTPPPPPNSSVSHGCSCRTPPPPLETSMIGNNCSPRASWRREECPGGGCSPRPIELQCDAGDLPIPPPPAAPRSRPTAMWDTDLNRHVQQCRCTCGQLGASGATSASSGHNSFPDWEVSQI